MANYALTLTETSTVSETTKKTSMVTDSMTVTDTFALLSWRRSLTERSVVRDSWALAGNELASARYRR